ncbi:MAG: hypothetical protein JKY19_12240 [Alcanivoracaceae bacterium]|nr:hypothetical protein [Alcanivoracaceae bacterium]
MIKSLGENDPKVEAVADFLTSGCNKCFDRYWQGTNVPEALDWKIPEASSSRQDCYNIMLNDGLFNIVSKVLPTINTDSSEGNNSPFGTLLAAFVDQFHQFWQGEGEDLSVPVWTVAVSAGHDNSVDQALKSIDGSIKLVNKVKTVKKIQIDCAAYEAGVDPGFADQLDAALVSVEEQWWNRGANRLAIWLYHPAVITTVILLLMGMPVLVAYIKDYPAGLLPKDMADIGNLVVFFFNEAGLFFASLPAVVKNTSIHWYESLTISSFASDLGLLFTFVIIMLLSTAFLLNRLLPPLYHLKVIPQWLNNFISSNFHLNSVRVFLKKYSYSLNGWHYWIRRKLFGPWWRAPAMVIIDLRNVVGWNINNDSEERYHDMARLRDLFSLRRHNQTLLIITRVPGLPYLPTAFLNVWFANNKAQQGFSKSAQFNGAWLVDDPVAEQIPDKNTHAQEAFSMDFKIDNIEVNTNTEFVAKPTMQSAVVNDSDDDNDSLFRLAKILGWEQIADVSDDTAKQEFNKLANTLAYNRFTLLNYLPTLILGSTSFSFIKLRKLEVEGKLNIDNDITGLFPFAHLLPSEEKDQLDSAEFERNGSSVEKAEGLILLKKTDAPYRYWIGNAGYRVELAEVLRDVLGRKEQLSLLQKAFGKENPVESYLCRHIACGELFNLNRFKDHFDKRDLADLPRLLEAALFLLKERTRLSGSSSLLAPVSDQWQQTWSLVYEQPLHNSCLVNPQSASQASRLCCDLLSAAKNLEGCLNFSVMMAEIQTSIKDPIACLKNSTTTLWQLFIHDLADHMLYLTGLHPRVSEQALESLFKQDWYYAPSEFSEMVRTWLDNVSDSIMHALDQVDDKKQLFEIAQLSGNFPELIIINIGVICTYHIRNFAIDQQQDASKDVAKSMLLLAAAVKGIHKKAPTAASPFSISKKSAQTIFELFTDHNVSHKLAEIFDQGLQVAKELSKINPVPILQAQHLESMAVTDK